LVQTCCCYARSGHNEDRTGNSNKDRHHSLYHTRTVILKTAPSCDNIPQSGNAHLDPDVSLHTLYTPLQLQHNPIFQKAYQLFWVGQTGWSLKPKQLSEEYTWLH